jgi:pimeloyl-ACP methyl ester carboxylesterase
VNPTVVLIHGGLGDDMNADRFWFRPGVVGGLRAAGFSVVAPDRDTAPSSWGAAADAIAAELRASTSVVAGSNGVSVAVRLALQQRPLVDRLLLLWPATCGDPLVDAATPAAASHLLAGDTLRGVTDAELVGLDVPVALMAAHPANRFHADQTVDRLLELIPRAARISAGFPESPRPEFDAVCDAFIANVVPYLR